MICAAGTSGVTGSADVCASILWCRCERDGARKPSPEPGELAERRDRRARHRTDHRGDAWDSSTGRGSCCDGKRVRCSHRTCVLLAPGWIDLRNSCWWATMFVYHPSRFGGWVRGPLRRASAFLGLPGCRLPERPVSVGHYGNWHCASTDGRNCLKNVA